MDELKNVQCKPVPASGDTHPKKGHPPHREKGHPPPRRDPEWDHRGGGLDRAIASNPVPSMEVVKSPHSYKT